MKLSPQHRLEHPQAKLNRRFFLPRLAREAYQGFAFVHWTMPVAARATGWLDDRFHARFRELMLHVAVRENLLCPVYCLMPDHIHLVWMGLCADTDQKNGMAFFRTHLEPELGGRKFQHQPHDHVLQEEERKQDQFANACGYILMNPVKDGLVTKPGEWKFSGCLLPGYPNLNFSDADFWPLFWRLYWKLRGGENQSLLTSAAT